MHGSKSEVYHGTADRTSGGLKKSDLKKKGGRIVSKAKSAAAKKNPGLYKFLQALTVYKETAGIPVGQFFPTPKKGTTEYAKIMEIYKKM
jgi:hypothetical protein